MLTPHQKAIRLKSIEKKSGINSELYHYSHVYYTRYVTYKLFSYAYISDPTV